MFPLRCAITAVLTYWNGLALDGRGLLVADLLDDVQDFLRDVALLPVSDGVRNISALKNV